MIIEHNKKVKLNNLTPYPSGSKTKPNPTLGKSTPVPQQVISKHVKDIYQPLISSNKLTKDHKNGSTYNILIEWETGEQTWETKDSNKWKEATVYDKKHIINAQKGHQKIKVHFVLDVNHCEGFKARLVADGHFTKELMATVYSGIPFAEPNNLESCLQLSSTHKGETLHCEWS